MRRLFSGFWNHVIICIVFIFAVFAELTRCAFRGPKLIARFGVFFGSTVSGRCSRCISVSGISIINISRAIASFCGHTFFGYLFKDTENCLTVSPQFCFFFKNKIYGSPVMLRGRDKRSCTTLHKGLWKTSPRFWCLGIFELVSCFFQFH